jgi:hypothetical protein
MPSTPGYPQGRVEATRVPSRREYESFDNLESFTAILTATTSFQEVASFSGTPESVHINTIGGPVDVRVRYRGEAAGNFVHLPANGQLELKVPAQFIEARDPAGAGAQAVMCTGRYGSRGIDIRQSRNGPARETELLAESTRARQIEARG